jgi:phosphate transport system protein
MGHLAEAILEKAVQCVWDRDPDLAKDVAEDDLPIDRLDIEIDRAVLEFLALQAPVAQDLREVVAIKTAATDLERVGDIARNIAESAIRLSEMPELAVPAPLQDLARSSQRALKNAILSFADYDVDLARSVLTSDDAIDDDEEKAFRVSLEQIHGNPANSEQSVHYILIGRNLERVGDHATNIAEDVVLVVESLNLKHAEKFVS